MASGRDNKLIAQAGEFLVCAELGKRGLIATPFAGNVPEFDVIATDNSCRTVPIQVKTTQSWQWPSQANRWLDITLEEATGKQLWTAPCRVSNPTLIYVLVAIDPRRMERDRFFVMTKQEIQAAYISGYMDWMNPRNWIRPRKRDSLDNRISTANIVPFENRWDLIAGAFWELPQPRADREVIDLAKRLLEAKLRGDWTGFEIWPGEVKPGRRLDDIPSPTPE